MKTDPNQDPVLSKNAGIVIAVLFATATTILWAQGRVSWCQEGDWMPWSWDIWTPHNSQHVLDPYAFTHVLHGILEFWLIGLVFRKMPMAWRLVLAVAIEGTWEVVENSTFIIERYRTVTLSLDYFGDSIINSIADMFCCTTGFVIAYKLRFWRSLALFIATELILIFWIRDSLVINIIMLIYPIEALKIWQMGSH